VQDIGVSGSTLSGSEPITCASLQKLSDPVPSIWPRTANLVNVIAAKWEQEL
jgi:hypothetical protein